MRRTGEPKLNLRPTLFKTKDGKSDAMMGIYAKSAIRPSVVDMDVTHWEVTVELRTKLSGTASMSYEGESKPHEIPCGNTGKTSSSCTYQFGHELGSDSAELSFPMPPMPVIARAFNSHPYAINMVVTPKRCAIQPKDDSSGTHGANALLKREVEAATQQYEKFNRHMCLLCDEKIKGDGTLVYCKQALPQHGITVAGIKAAGGFLNAMKELAKKKTVLSSGRCVEKSKCPASRRVESGSCCGAGVASCHASGGGTRVFSAGLGNDLVKRIAKTFVGKLDDACHRFAPHTVRYGMISVFPKGKTSLGGLYDGEIIKDGEEYKPNGRGRIISASGLEAFETTFAKGVPMLGAPFRFSSGAVAPKFNEPLPPVKYRWEVNPATGQLTTPPKLLYAGRKTDNKGNPIEVELYRTVSKNGDTDILGGFTLAAKGGATDEVSAAVGSADSGGSTGVDQQATLKAAESEALDALDASEKDVTFLKKRISSGREMETEALLAAAKAQVSATERQIAFVGAQIEALRASQNWYADRVVAVSAAAVVRSNSFLRPLLGGMNGLKDNSFDVLVVGKTGSGQSGLVNSACNALSGPGLRVSTGREMDSTIQMFKAAWKKSNVYGSYEFPWHLQPDGEGCSGCLGSSADFQTNTPPPSCQPSGFLNGGYGGTVGVKADDLKPGKYTIHSNTKEGESFAKESKEIRTLSARTVVNVVEIRDVPTDKRIRGRLASGGWISLVNTEDNYRWATKLGSANKVRNYGAGDDSDSRASGLAFKQVRESMVAQSAAQKYGEATKLDAEAEVFGNEAAAKETELAAVLGNEAAAKETELAALQKKLDLTAKSRRSTRHLLKAATGVAAEQREQAEEGERRRAQRLTRRARRQSSMGQQLRMRASKKEGTKGSSMSAALLNKDPPAPTTKTFDVQIFANSDTMTVDDDAEGDEKLVETKDFTLVPKSIIMFGAREGHSDGNGKYHNGKWEKHKTKFGMPGKPKKVMYKYTVSTIDTHYNQKYYMFFYTDAASEARSRGYWGIARVKPKEAKYGRSFQKDQFKKSKSTEVWTRCETSDTSTSPIGCDSWKQKDHTTINTELHVVPGEVELKGKGASYDGVYKARVGRAWCKGQTSITSGESDPLIEGQPCYHYDGPSGGAICANKDFHWFLQPTAAIGKNSGWCHCNKKPTNMNSPSGCNEWKCSENGAWAVKKSMFARDVTPAGVFTTSIRIGVYDSDASLDSNPVDRRFHYIKNGRKTWKKTIRVTQELRVFWYKSVEDWGDAPGAGSWARQPISLTGSSEGESMLLCVAYSVQEARGKNNRCRNDNSGQNKILTVEQPTPTKVYFVNNRKGAATLEVWSKNSKSPTNEIIVVLPGKNSKNIEWNNGDQVVVTYEGQLHDVYPFERHGGDAALRIILLPPVNPQETNTVSIAAGLLPGDSIIVKFIDPPSLQVRDGLFQKQHEAKMKALGGGAEAVVIAVNGASTRTRREDAQTMDQVRAALGNDEKVVKSKIVVAFTQADNVMPYSFQMGDKMKKLAVNAPGGYEWDRSYLKHYQRVEQSKIQGCTADYQKQGLGLPGEVPCSMTSCVPNAQNGGGSFTQAYILPQSAAGARWDDTFLANTFSRGSKQLPTLDRRAALEAVDGMVESKTPYPMTVQEMTSGKAIVGQHEKGSDAAKEAAIVKEAIVEYGKQMNQFEGGAAHVKVVVMGKTGVGKSTLAKMLFQGATDKCTGAIRSTKVGTTESEGYMIYGKDANGRPNGAQIEIIDTPGFFDTRSYETGKTDDFKQEHVSEGGPLVST